MTLGLLAAGLVLVLLALILPPQAAMVLGLLLVMASSASLPILEPVNIGVRILAISVILTLAARTPLGANARSRDDRSTAPWIVAFVFAIGLMLSFISIAHNETGIVPAVLGAVSALVVAFAPLRVLTPRQVIQAIRDALLLVLLASLVLAAAAPGIAFRGGRLQGLSGNANLLGFYVLLYLGLVLATSTKVQSLVMPVSLSGFVLILSGSRASAVAVVALFLASALLRVGATRRLLPFLMVGALGAMLLAQDLLTSNTGLLRANNSRSESWNQAKGALQLDLLRGVGLEGLKVQVASSPLRALAAGGLIAGGLLLFGLFCLLVAARRNSTLKALTFAAVLHSFAEGWLVSLTGPMILLFVTSLSALAVLPLSLEDEFDTRTGGPPADSGGATGDEPRGGQTRTRGSRRLDSSEVSRTLPTADPI